MRMSYQEQHHDMLVLFPFDDYAIPFQKRLRPRALYVEAVDG